MRESVSGPIDANAESTLTPMLGPRRELTHARCIYTRGIASHVETLYLHIELQFPKTENRERRYAQPYNAPHVLALFDPRGPFHPPSYPAFARCRFDSPYRPIGGLRLNYVPPESTNGSFSFNYRPSFQVPRHYFSSCDIKRARPFFRSSRVFRVDYFCAQQPFRFSEERRKRPLPPTFLQFSLCAQRCVGNICGYSIPAALKPALSMHRRRRTDSRSSHTCVNKSTRRLK